MNLKKTKKVLPFSKHFLFPNQISFITHMLYDENDIHYTNNGVVVRILLK